MSRSHDLAPLRRGRNSAFCKVVHSARDFGTCLKSRKIIKSQNFLCLHLPLLQLRNAVLDCQDTRLAVTG